MTGVQVGIEFDRVLTGAGRIGEAAETFQQVGRQVGGLPAAAAPRQRASELLDRFLTAFSGALGVVERELAGHADALEATVSSYQRAEETLIAGWRVPGMGA